MAPPRRIVETASRRPQHSCSLQLLLPLIVRCWCLRRRLESSAAAAASASASASPSWLSVQAQLSELHISGQERTCFALTPSPSRSSQNFRNMPATKLWKVLAFRLGFFPPSLGAGQFGNQNTTTEEQQRTTRGSRQQPIGSGPLHSSATWDEYTLAGRMWGKKREKKHDFSWPFTTTLLTSALNGTLNYNQAEQ